MTPTPDILTDAATCDSPGVPHTAPGPVSTGPVSTGGVATGTAGSVLAAYGYGAAQAQALAAFAEAEGLPALLPARVVRVERNIYRVQVEGGNECGAVWPGGRRHKVLDTPVIGDWVACSVPSGAAEDEGSSAGLLPKETEPLRIESVLARQNAFIRAVQKGHRTQPQVLAANVDTVLIVTSPQEWDFERLERYIRAVHLSGAQPVIVLNKADTAAPGALAQLERLAAERWAPEQAPVLSLSARGGQGLDTLTPYLRPGQTVALIGSSGVGKSTLTNRLMGAEAAATGSSEAAQSAEVTATGTVSAASGEGRHTTTWRTLYRLPKESGNGALLIDNPGLRDIAVWDEEGAAFWAIEQLAAECRFSRCTHGREPGCAVRAAAERGELDWDVLAHYRESTGAAGPEAGKPDPRSKSGGGRGSSRRDETVKLRKGPAGRGGRRPR